MDPHELRKINVERQLSRRPIPRGLVPSLPAGMTPAQAAANYLGVKRHTRVPAIISSPGIDKKLAETYNNFLKTRTEAVKEAETKIGRSYAKVLKEIKKRKRAEKDNDTLRKFDSIEFDKSLDKIADDFFRNSSRLRRRSTRRKRKRKNKNKNKTRNKKRKPSRRNGK
jgi:hypothetical protein